MPHSFSQRFDIEPHPTPRLRFRRLGKGVATYYSGDYVDYMNRIGDAYTGHSFGEGPVSVELTFSIPRPKSHYGTGRNSEVVKPDKPAYPTTRADIDNYVKGVLDALKGRAWADDKQVVQVQAAKRWGEPFIQVFIQRYEPA